jgi:hypothetical protein
VDDSVDVGRAQPTIDQSLKTAWAGIEENAVAFSRLKEVAGRSAARVEFDGPRTQNGEAHGWRLTQGQLFARIGVEIAVVQCETHPQNLGVAACVRCSVVVCSDCTTRLQGRNFCAGCLQRMASPEEQAIATRSNPGFRRLIAVLVPCSAAALLGAFVTLGYLLHRLS